MYPNISLLQSQHESHEVQIGNFSVIGRTTVPVLRHINDICLKLNLPWFVDYQKNVLICLGHIQESNLRKKEYKNTVILLNYREALHHKIALDYIAGNICWYSTQSPLPSEIRGISFNPETYQVTYSNGARTEHYDLSHQKSVPFELILALAALREAGVSELRLKLALELTQPPVVLKRQKQS